MFSYLIKYNDSASLPNILINTLAHNEKPEPSAHFCGIPQ